MSTRPNGAPFPDADRILAGFFADEAPQYEPPVLLPAVLARTALTRRRPAWRIPSWWLPASIAWRPRTPGRSNTMFSVMRFATLGAILALASGVLYATVTLSPSPGGLTSSPSPTASPIALPDGDLEAGTTYFLDDLWAVGSADLILTVPATGWSNGGGNLKKDLIADPVGGVHAEVLITPWWRARNLIADPCHWRSGGELDPPVGPTADDLATALVEQAAGNASAPTDVTVGGYPGKRVELSLPVALDIATCDGGEFFRWWDESGGMKGGWPPSGNSSSGQRRINQSNIVYILDVGDMRAVIDTLYTPGASEADLAEAEQLIASMRFEWPAPSPSPST